MAPKLCTGEYMLVLITEVVNKTMLRISVNISLMSLGWNVENERRVTGLSNDI